jgi:hypothetical protein
MANFRFGKMLAVSAVLATTFLSVSASAESKARIVRLSEVQGMVQMDRAAGDGFDKAFINLPVIEASKIRTGKDGRAEVEFEDGSALRLAPNSEIDFARLALGDDGQKFTTVQLVEGTVYANLHAAKSHATRSDDNSGEKKGDRFDLNFANESISIAQAAHFRVELAGANKASVAVFKGKVSANGPFGQFDVAEKHSASIAFAKDELAKNDVDKDVVTKSKDEDAVSTKSDSSAKDTFTIAKNYEAEPSDDWDRQQSDYHDRYASIGTSNALTPYGYGVSDLNYYGSFMNVAGYGSVWQPYFMGANWSPFQDGGWAFYPGPGYAFVSGYPWGWAPYHSGNWVFIPSYGWVWEPGAYGNSFYAVPQLVNSPVKTKLVTPPVSGRQTVMVGRGLAANPAAGAPRRLTIDPGSAGFGVPRGAVNHLDHLAKTVDRTSRPVTVSTAPPVSTASQTAGWGGGNLGSTRSTGSMAAPWRSATPAPAQRAH